MRTGVTSRRYACRKDGYRVVIPDSNVSDASGRGDRAGSGLLRHQEQLASALRQLLGFTLLDGTDETAAAVGVVSCKKALISASNAVRGNQKLYRNCRDVYTCCNGKREYLIKSAAKDSRSYPGSCRHGREATLS